jgi:hypothetical protein
MKPSQVQKLHQQGLMRNNLIHAVTMFDMRNKHKPDYNPYALSQYIATIDDALDDLKAGEQAREAFTKRFNGQLLDIVLKTAGLSKATKEEKL